MSPIAPPPPPVRETAEEETRRKRKEDYKLRELRIFLRDICRKLASNRRFYKFTKPVDLEEVGYILFMNFTVLIITLILSRRQTDTHFGVCNFFCDQ